MRNKPKTPHKPSTMPGKVIDAITVPFTLEAGPGTDIWRKPPSTNVWSAPVIGTVSRPLKSFLSARITFWALWAHSYDQAGLLLVPRLASSTASPPSHWVKTGIEFYAGQPLLSTVTCDRFADWGLYPLTCAASVDRVTLEVFRDGGAQGKNAWVHRVVLDQDGNEVERIPLRKICWIFADEDEGDWVLDVSPLVARPEKDAIDALRVEFMEFKVEWVQ
ncbi:uncharacterized protein BCR38DRAFT_440837 [Pseudomassariella vexata]|uniref:Uncharacterized protein n=1 Tax=Pseudomassariella vexata TaxID=1141098 RepID=A0A1Y2DQX9_9PEZI|nr:uncharacterized protein BCR38DRAFT_440837 [Pseudomassariella vexata]ORY61671.1 hypothetical protein BCR38DRAFT_440837 [Pseudomassariella vexata]